MRQKSAVLQHRCSTFGNPRTRIIDTRQNCLGNDRTSNANKHSPRHCTALHTSPPAVLPLCNNAPRPVAGLQLQLRVCAARASCDVGQQRPGCRIHAGQCVCGIGCRSEYQYADKQECTTAIKGTAWSLVPGTVNVQHQQPARHVGCWLQAKSHEQGEEPDVKQRFALLQVSGGTSAGETLASTAGLAARPPWTPATNVAVRERVSTGHGVSTVSREEEIQYKGFNSAACTFIICFQRQSDPQMNEVKKDD